MKHVKALFIKFVMIAAVLGIVFTGVYDKAFGDTLLISAVLTITAYILGDLLIFCKTGSNALATLSDAILAFLVIWFMAKTVFVLDPNMLMASFLSALLVAAGEWFFHKYLAKHVCP